RHTSFSRDWSSDVCSSDLKGNVVTIAVGGDDTPLFCIHGGDGGVLFYRSLATLMPPEIPLHAIESLELGSSGPIESFTIEETARSEERRVGKECRAAWAPR